MWKNSKHKHGLTFYVLENHFVYKNELEGCDTKVDKELRSCLTSSRASVVRI